MKIETVKGYSNTKFRRITGIKRATFELMVKILSVAYAFKHEKGGRRASLSIEEMLLSSLEYWREYRSYAHIGASYGIDESNIYRTIKWVEKTLIECEMFSLPGKKALRKEEKKYKVILIDATESPTEHAQDFHKLNHLLVYVFHLLFQGAFSRHSYDDHHVYALYTKLIWHSPMFMIIFNHHDKRKNSIFLHFTPLFLFLSR